MFGILPRTGPQPCGVQFEPKSVGVAVSQTPVTKINPVTIIPDRSATVRMGGPFLCSANRSDALPWHPCDSRRHHSTAATPKKAQCSQLLIQEQFTRRLSRIYTRDPIGRYPVGCEFVSCATPQDVRAGNRYRAGYTLLVNAGTVRRHVTPSLRGLQ